jgi:hypothetical protein
MKCFVLAGLAGAMISTGVFAEEGNDQQQLTLSSLQAKCTELASNPQTVPFKATVSCGKTSFRWVPDQVGAFALRSSCIVGASIQMKSYYLAPQNTTLPLPDAVQPCGKYKKVVDTIGNVDVELSCSELAAIENLADFCQPHLEARIQEDPELVTTADTEETYSLCPDTSALSTSDTSSIGAGR